MARALQAVIGFAAALFLFSFIATAAPARACTEMWCVEGLTVDLKTDDWPEGKYRFTVTADGKTMRCDSHLPFTSCEAQNTKCDSDEVLIGESGCALPKSDHTFYNLTVRTIPENFSLTIEHESGKRFIYSAPVTKQCGYPNGKGCDPRECCSARLTADVQWQ